MRRAHRRAHFYIWPALALLMLIGVTLALVWRPPPEKAAARMLQAAMELAS